MVPVNGDSDCDFLLVILATRRLEPPLFNIIILEIKTLDFMDSAYTTLIQIA